MQVSIHLFLLRCYKKKYHILGDLSNRTADIYFSQLWRLRIPRSWCWQVREVAGGTFSLASYSGRVKSTPWVSL